jgi:hypothetical protein
MAWELPKYRDFTFHLYQLLQGIRWYETKLNISGICINGIHAQK